MFARGKSASERTLSASTRSAASNRVSVEIWSTIAEILGLSEAGGGGGVDDAAAGVGSALEDEVEAKERERQGITVDLEIKYIK